MYRYPSNITFLYYGDYQYGVTFIEEVIDLPLIMDQGFARVYQINTTSFVGIVDLAERKQETGNTLLSLNTNDVQLEYTRIATKDVYELTDIKHFESIPLNSFFFQDKEGHRFEIQEFIKEEDKIIFNK